MGQAQNTRVEAGSWSVLGSRSLGERVKGQRRDGPDAGSRTGVGQRQNTRVEAEVEECP